MARHSLSRSGRPIVERCRETVYHAANRWKNCGPTGKMDLVTEFCVCVTSLICGWHVLRRNDAVKIREMKMLPCVNLIDGPASKLSTLKENF